MNFGYERNQKKEVENLQTYLRLVSYHYPTVSPPPVDGIFGADTETSLSQFQELVGLPITGRADRTTWETLYALYRATLPMTEPPAAVHLFPTNPSEFSLSVGDTGFSVAAVQYMLRELGRDIAPLEELRVDGRYGQSTEEAVKSFQLLYGLFPTGRVDRGTWNTLAGAHNTLFLHYPHE